MLFNLLKLEFLATLNSFNGGKRSKKKKTGSLVSAVILMAFLSVYFAGISFFFSMSLNTGAMLIGETELAITMMFFLVSVVSLSYTMFKSSSILFTFKDFDLLFSMPIKGSTIIQSKILFLYFSNFIFKLLIMIPAIISWVIVTSPSFIQVLLVSLSVPFINLIPMVIASFFGFVVSFISSFFRKSAIVNTLMSIIGIFAIMFISFTISYSSNTVGQASAEFANQAMQTLEQLNSFYPLTLMFSSIAKGDITAFIIFVLISVVSFIAFSAFVGKNFLKVRTRLNSHSSKRKAVEIKGDAKGHLKNIILKELKLLVSTPIYAMNILTGIVMGFAGVGYMIYIGISQPDFFIFISEYDMYIYPVVPFVLSFFVGYVSTTACSISLEGKNLWMLKSMPIKASTIFFGKCLFNIILQVPIAVLAGIVISFLFKSNLIWSMIFILIPSTMCVFNTFVSLLLNIRFPMLDWENPAVPVKRGAPIMIMVFVNLALYMGGGFLAFLIFTNSMQEMFFIITFIIINIINLILALYINKNSEKMLLLL